MAERVAAIAEETIPELASYYYTADSGQSASLVLNLTDKGERDRSAPDIANALRDATYDVAGCELGGVLKNPIALGCGIARGMGLGDNTVAALMTRGMT